MGDFGEHFGLPWGTLWSAIRELFSGLVPGRLRRRILDTFYGACGGGLGGIFPGKGGGPGFSLSGSLVPGVVLPGLGGFSLHKNRGTQHLPRQNACFFNVRGAGSNDIQVGIYMNHWNLKKLQVGQKWDLKIANLREN